MQLIVLGLAACAAASGSSFQRVWRVDGYDQVPTEYGVEVNGYNAIVDEDRVGRLGKREAEPSYAPALAYHPAGGYGYNKYGPGYSYTDRSPQGLHKREASGSSYQNVDRTDCYGYNCQNSEYNVKVNGYNADIDEVRDGKNFAFQYGFNI